MCHDRSPHVIGVLTPGRGVEARGDETPKCKGRQASGQDAIASSDDDPDQQDKSKGKEQMRLQGTEPQGSAGSERAGFVQAKEKGQSKQQQDGGLTQNYAEKCRGEAVSQPV